MIVAITGGIGSGKTEVLKAFFACGAKIISADEVNTALLNDAEYIKKLEKLFPSVVQSGVVNRKKLGEIVFGNEVERKKLNALAHPEIMKRLFLEVEKTAEFTVAEIPLFTELEDKSRFDKVVVVTAEEELRVARVMKRDNVTAEYAKKVIKSQCDEKKLLEFATDVIKNDGNYEVLRNIVLQLISHWNKGSK